MQDMFLSPILEIFIHGKSAESLLHMQKGLLKFKCIKI